VSEADFIAAQDTAARAARPARRCGGICWPAGGAVGGWSQPGPTASPPTGAATATPAPPAQNQDGPGTSTYGRTRSFGTWPAVAILLAGAAGETGCVSRGLAQLTGPDGTAALIGQLRAGGTVLTIRPAGPCAPTPRHVVRHHRQGPLTAEPGKEAAPMRPPIRRRVRCAAGAGAAVPASAKLYDRAGEPDEELA
jgi:hypothetical protein